MPTAVAIDGAYFLKRFKHSFPNCDPANPDHVAWGVGVLARYHIGFRLFSSPILQAIGTSVLERPAAPLEEVSELYRIFFYDCPPLKKRVQLRVSGKPLDFGTSKVAVLREKVHAALNNQRKVALRLGRLNEGASGWKPTPEAIKRWFAEPGGFQPTDDDFVYDIVQKGVDMRLGLDLAAMAFKRQIDQLVLVAADADFVPAVKLARREGIDIVLDPMWGNVAPDLLQHVDGVRNTKIDAQPVFSGTA